MRVSADVVLKLVPRSTGVEVTQERGHVYILTDLLLMCERMTPQEQAQYGPDGPDMWLLYPPLAGKHLKVAPVEGSGTLQRKLIPLINAHYGLADTGLDVIILRKETVRMFASSRQLRDKIVAEFRECIDSAQVCEYSLRKVYANP